MSSEPSPMLLSVRRLRKTYGRRTVLDGISFDLPAGCVAALGGDNGAGKSTLLRCLSGVARFDGSVSVAGESIDGSARARRLCGYVPQNVDLPEWATVGEVLQLFDRLRGRLRGTGDRSPLLPDRFLPARDRRIGTLSGGQRQRVVLAAALAGGPRLLLLDEPAASLDRDGRKELWTAVEALAAAGSSALIASPAPADLVAFADREIVLRDGFLVHNATLCGQPEIRSSAPGDAASKWKVRV